MAHKGLLPRHRGSCVATLTSTSSVECPEEMHTRTASASPDAAAACSGFWEVVDAAIDVADAMPACGGGAATVAIVSALAGVIPDLQCYTRDEQRAQECNSTVIATPTHVSFSICRTCLLMPTVCQSLEFMNTRAAESPTAWVDQPTGSTSKNTFFKIFTLLFNPTSSFSSNEALVWVCPLATSRKVTHVGSSTGSYKVK